VLEFSNFFNYFISLECHFFFLLAQEEKLTEKEEVQYPSALCAVETF